MEHSKPLVSIGMPVYNGERFLNQALDSLLSQDYTHLEIIISDNASQDGTEKICREYTNRDPRVHYHRNSENIGPEKNFNKTLEFAQGEYFMWAACDDLWEPSFISTQISNLKKHPSASLAFCAFNSIDENNSVVRLYKTLFDLPSENLFQRLSNFINQNERLGKANPIYSLMRKDTIIKAGGMKIWGKSQFCFDILIVFKLFSMGNLILSEDLLFHKRARTTKPQKERLSFGERTKSYLRHFGNYYSQFRKWRGYFQGYFVIIDQMDELSNKEKTLLKKLVQKRARTTCWNEFIGDIQNSFQLFFNWIFRKVKKA